MQSRAEGKRFIAPVAAVSAVAGITAVVIGAPAGVVIALLTIALAGGVATWCLVGRTSSPATTELLAHLSHELRTPLTGILGTLELLTESAIPLEAAEVDELLVAAHQDANYMLHLVGNLHTASRLERDVLQPNLEPVNLRTVVNHALARNLSVSRRSLLPTGPPVVAMADPQLLMQIVTNIMQNAERYAPEGEVEIAFELADERATIIFSDDGPGVPPSEAAHIFEDGPSSRGLGIGLGLSRRLARAMGGDLELVSPRRSGATFRLALPASQMAVPDRPVCAVIPADRANAYSPRARLLVDMAKALAERSLDRVVGGMQKLYSELLGATGGVLLLPGDDGRFRTVGCASGQGQWSIPLGDPTMQRVLAADCPTAVDQLDQTQWRQLQPTIGGNAALLLPVHDDGRIAGVLVIGWKNASAIPSGPAVAVAEAMADLAASAIERSELADNVIFERELRSSVLDSLPIAVSVFVGDPPRIIDWNRKERELLALSSDIERPKDLELSQHMFNVRFADGTPLDVDNAPATIAIRSGMTTGPFILILRRADGSEVHTRTYCAPFFRDDGSVGGAVVTSEPLDVVVSPSVTSTSTTAL